MGVGPVVHGWTHTVLSEHLFIGWVIRMTDDPLWIVYPAGSNIGPVEKTAISGTCPKLAHTDIIVDVE